MPITVTAPRGVLTPAGESQILPKLSAALLDAGDATGNAFVRSMVGGTVQLLSAEHIYSGGVNRPVVMVELKLPNVVLTSVAAREKFIIAAIAIVDELTVADYPASNTTLNILNAPDGGWGAGGRAWTGEALIEAATASATKRQLTRAS